MYKNEDCLPANSRLTIHISIPFLNADELVKNSSFEFNCFYCLTKNKEVQDTVLAVLSQIEKLKIACSEYEKSILSKKLKDAITKAISSIKIEEETAEQTISLSDEILIIHSNDVLNDFSLVGLNTLRCITIDNNSLLSLPQMNLSNCPNLVEITVGDGCFAVASQCVITDCENLVSLSFGRNSFPKAQQCLLTNCTSLKKCEWNAGCFANEDKLSSTAIISDCPGLEDLVFQCYSFHGYSSLLVNSS